MSNKIKKTKKQTFEEKVLAYLSCLPKILALLSDKNASAELPKASSDNRFVDCGDGTIKDTKTGLMWAKDGSSETMSHEKAEKYCKESSLAGYKDWRLPTVEELASLIDYKKYNPAIVSDLFNVKTDDWYWTGTIYADSSDFAWIVDFYLGRVHWCYRDNGNYVRPVRQY